MWQEQASLSWQVLNLKLQRRNFLVSSSQFHIYVTILRYILVYWKLHPDLKFLVLDFASECWSCCSLIIFFSRSCLWLSFSFLLWKVFRLQKSLHKIQRKMRLHFKWKKITLCRYTLLWQKMVSLYTTYSYFVF